MAEIAADQVRQEAAVLRVDRAIEAPIMPNLLQVGGIGAYLALHLDRIPAEPDQREDDRDEQPESDDAVEGADEDVLLHATRRPLSRPLGPPRSPMAMGRGRPWYPSNDGTRLPLGARGGLPRTRTGSRRSGRNNTPR